MSPALQTCSRARPALALQPLGSNVIYTQEDGRLPLAVGDHDSTMTERLGSSESFGQEAQETGHRDAVIVKSKLLT